MCRLESFLKKELVICGLKVTNKDEVFEKICMQIEKSCGISSQEVLKAIKERESYGTTGIGSGIAIPHARISSAQEIVVSIAALENGVEYGSLDGEDVKLVFMLIVPEGKNLVYLKLLSQISLMCNDKTVRNELLKAGTEEEIINIIRSID
jgi:fructose-specific phosphotransferase system IIA component